MFLIGARQAQSSEVIPFEFQSHALSFRSKFSDRDSMLCFHLQNCSKRFLITNALIFLLHGIILILCPEEGN